MRVADRLQIKVLQEAALGYLEGIPWQGEEAVLVQEACQSVGFPTDALQKRLLQDGLSIASRQMFLKTLLENVGGADNILTLAKDVLREGTVFSDRSVVIEVLENQLKVLTTDLMEKLKNVWDRYSDKHLPEGDVTVLGRISNHAEFKTEAGFTITDIVHLLVKCTSTSVQKPYFHGLWQPKLRNAFQRQLYQHLVAAARRGRPVLGHDCRAKLLSLWTPAFETDNVSREKRVTADVRALFSTLDQAEREKLCNLWLPDILKATQQLWDPSLKGWLVDIFSIEPQVRALLLQPACGHD
jgi:hypothetical protein